MRGALETRIDPKRPAVATAAATPPALAVVLTLCLTLACYGGHVRGGEPRRIVALAPNVTEILFALGLDRRVVGVGRYSSWPPEVESKARLGGLTDPGLETVVSLQPDLAILLASEDDLGRRLQRLGIEVLTVRNDTLDEVADSIVAIAERCGVAARGRALLARWHLGLEPRPVAPGIRTVLVVGRTPGRLTDILVAAPGTFLDQLLVRLGGVNIFADVSVPYPQVGLEEIVHRQPEVILELQGSELSPAAAASLRSDWKKLPQIPAVMRGRVYVVAGDYVLIPGPRLPQLYSEMQRVLGVSSAAAALEVR